jgi:hypothetical protein
MTRLNAGLLASLMVLAFAAAAHAQTIKLGQAMVFLVPDLKPGADLKAFETYVTKQAAPAWAKGAPGSVLTLVKKDRGPHAGQYLLVWTTDTLAHHEALASTSGDFPFSAAAIGKAGDIRAGLAPFVSGPGKYVEYHMVAPDKVGAPLPEVDVLGNHYIKVRPDRVAAFDTFIGTKLHPMVGSLKPDLRFLYYKPVRGEDAGNYLTVVALTRSSRDKYWPKGQDSDDLKAAFVPPVRTLATAELQPFLVDGTWGTGMTAQVYEAKDWADWLIVN